MKRKTDPRRERSGLPRNDDGTLNGIAFPGGYTIAFYFGDGERACHNCACEYDARNKATEADPNDWLEPSTTITMHDIRWEGCPESCAQCGAWCPSEYGCLDDCDCNGLGCECDKHDNDDDETEV